jgi:diacylglycerol kinase family enzyme
MYYYIVNPAAGGGRIHRVQDELRARLRDFGISGEFVKTLGEDDVVKLAQTGLEQGASTIVAVGGDSTTTEVIRALYGKPGVALGIIPIGHRNHLARLLGVSDWQAAPQILAARKVEAMNLGEIGGRYFVGSVGIGFEAAHPESLTLRQISSRKRMQQLPRYLSALRHYKPVEVSLTLDDQVYLKAKAFNISITNSRAESEFGFANSNPQDRKLDITIVSRLKPASVLRQIPNYLGGQIRIADEFSLFQAGRVEVNTPEPLPVHIDGEPLGNTPVTVTIAKHNVSLIVGRDRGF